MSEKAGESRQSNFELLRILAMVQILLVHYSVHGGGFGVETSPQKFQAMFFTINSYTPVNLFVMIGAYFLVDTKFKLERLLKTLFEVFFYSVVILFGMRAAGLLDASAVTIRQFFPVSTHWYWFATAYVVMMAVAPFINIGLNAMNQKQLLALCGTLLLLSYILPIFFGVGHINAFICLYVFTAYIKRYGIPLLDKKWIALAVYAAAHLLSYCYGVYRYRHLAADRAAREALFNSFSGLNSWVSLLMAVALFMFFKNLNIRHSRVINMLARCAFGVYLIHDNMQFSPYFWKELVQTPRVYYSTSYWWIAPLTCVGVYLVLSAVDLVRQYAVERPVFWVYGKLEKLVAGAFKKKSTDRD